jgi:hypothetical protein
MLLRKARHAWHQLDPALAPRLADARLQLHHAAQFVAAMGISFLPAAGDDSHTNMHWFAGTLASHVVGPQPTRLGLRPHPFELVVLGGDAPLATLPLHDNTINDAASWIRARLSAVGLSGERFTLDKHYTIPAHPVDRGAAFDASADAAFAELGRWYADAAMLLDVVAARSTNASPARC